jgi:molybdate transport system substrate-binding protein
VTPMPITKSFTMAILGSLLLPPIAIGKGAAVDEVRVLATVGLAAALNELGAKFEDTTGNKLKIEYSLVADIRKRILGGETADVVILSRPVMDELLKQKKLEPDTIENIAGATIVMAVKAGAPMPDISSVDALKRTLLAAKSIVYANPANGGLSGVYFARVLDRLGIADQLKRKTILAPGPQAGEIVADGEAEIGVAQSSEIVPVPGAQLVGPLPGEFASVTMFSAGIGAGTHNADAARALIGFLAGSAAAPVFKSKGLEPGK